MRLRLQTIPHGCLTEEERDKKYMTNNGMLIVVEKIIGGDRYKIMKTRKNRTGILIAIALIGVIALVGNAQASVEPVSGTVDSTVAEGQIVTLYLDINPADYVTVAVTDSPGFNDYYYFNDIEPILLRNGYSTGDSYDATVEMHCSGDERDINQVVGASYTNTFKNTTPSTAHFTGVYDGAIDVPPVMELEPCVTEGGTFSKSLSEGWTLVSLPLVPNNNSAGAVLSSIGEKYDAVYSYNAVTQQFEDVSGGTMDPGIGYFVHVTSPCTWTYGGTAYNSVVTELKSGLNMIGWLNCSKPINDALSSIDGNYYYVARFDASTQSFETYNPAAPNGFNDFTTMDRGTGYFISAKQDCILTESC